MPLHPLGLAAAVALLAFTSPALAQDADGDGLIDISTLEQLNNMRFNLAGTSYKAGDAAAGTVSGCPTIDAPYDPDNDPTTDNAITACYGYELMTDLDFDTDGDGTIGSNDAFWNDGAGWEPIGTTSDAPFTATFEGNDHTISNLFIDENTNNVGLFGYSGSGATIRNLGLVNVNVTGRDDVGALAGNVDSATIMSVHKTGRVSGNRIVGGLVGRSNGLITTSYALGTVSGNTAVGGLVGSNDGTITASYALGTVSGAGAGNRNVGGLVGSNGFSITASYAFGSISGNTEVGGLVGWSDGFITASYAVGTVSGSTDIGGLLGENEQADITTSYFDSTVAGLPEPSDADLGQTTTALRTPTTITGSDLYNSWNVDIDDDGEADNPWHFGNDMQYPGLALPAMDGACPAVPAFDAFITFAGDDAPHTVVLNIEPDANMNRCIHRARLVPPDPNDADYDRDGLIEIGTLDELNHIRFNLAGTSYKTTVTGAGDASGCPTMGCHGYELTADLDFDTRNDGVIDENDAFWNGSDGWMPIGDASTPFTATFEGNGHTISNLFIHRENTDDVGLFSILGNDASISNLGLGEANVVGRHNVGALAGAIRSAAVTSVHKTGRVSGDEQIGGLVGLLDIGSITASHASGRVSGDERIGGLVGLLDRGSITASHASGRVSGNRFVGGLAGRNEGSITASYALGTVSGSFAIVGGLTGRNDGAITASYALGTVSGSNLVGGLTGWNSSRITASYAVGAISGDIQVGGLVGGTTGNIRASYALGTVSAANPFLGGGLVGSEQAGRIEASYFDSTVAGLSGLMDAGRGRATTELQTPTMSTDSDPYNHHDWANNLWHFGDSMQYPGLALPVVGGICPVVPAFDVFITLAGATAPHTVVLNIEPDANTNRCIHRARLVPPNPEHADYDRDGLIDIGTLDELNHIRFNLTGTSYKTTDTGAGDDSGCPSVAGCHGYELMDDLNFDSDGDDVIGDGDAFWNEGAGWMPIGDAGTPFTATFEGNHHTISNLFIDRGTEDDIGLFGVSANNVIRNLGLGDANVVGRDNVGALAGATRSTTVTRVHKTGRVSGGEDVGGLVGRLDGGSITTSYVAGTISGNNGVGGLAGNTHNSGLITASFVHGAISGNNQVGGLAGRNSGRITASYALGTVSGNTDVGGLAATNGDEGAITASYAVGTVSGNSRVGGLAGRNSGRITASYALGTVSGNTDVDGLIGDYHFGTITESYFDSDVAGPSELRDAARGKTTTELQTPTTVTATNIYNGWDVDIDNDGEADTPWHFGESTQYPGLVLPALDGVCPVVATPPLDIFITFAGDDAPHTMAVGIESGVRTNRCIHRARLDPPNPDHADYDRDGLIDIATVDELNNIRFNLAGDSYKTSASDSGDASGCPSAGCRGYELTADLDFDTDKDGRFDPDDAFWNGGDGWMPIGSGDARFTAIFEGNGHTISNLVIDREETIHVGLFGISGNTVIRNLGLVAVKVAGMNNVGAVVGSNHSTVENVYTMGDVSGNDQVGGLIGLNHGPIITSYAVGTVSGKNARVGGLVGWHNDESITAGYAVGTVSGVRSVGGLVGATVSSITASYAVGTVSGDRSVGGLAGSEALGSTIAMSYFDSDIAGQSGLSDADFGQTTTDLQTPTTITGSDIYSGWNVDIDNDGTADTPWHFGNSMQYPGLALGAADAPCSEMTRHVGLGEDAPAWVVQQSELVDDQCIHRPIYVTIQDFSLAAADDLGTDNTDRITSTATVSLKGRVIPTNSTVRITVPTAPTELMLPSREIGADGVFETAMQVMLEEGSNRFSGHVTVVGVAETVGPIGLPEIILDTQAPRLFFTKTTSTDDCASAAGCEVTISSPTDMTATIRYIDGFGGDAVACNAVTYANVVEAPAAFPIYDPATSNPIRIDANTPQCFIATDRAGNLYSRFSGDIVSALRLRLKILLEGALQ